MALPMIDPQTIRKPPQMPTPYPHTMRARTLVWQRRLDLRDNGEFALWFMEHQLEKRGAEVLYRGRANNYQVLIWRVAPPSTPILRILVLERRGHRHHRVKNHAFVTSLRNELLLELAHEALYDYDQHFEDKVGSEFVKGFLDDAVIHIREGDNPKQAVEREYCLTTSNPFANICVGADNWMENFAQMQ